MTGHSPDSGVREFSGNVMADQVPAGTHDHSESLLRAVPCDIEDVLPEERLATAQHDNRPAGRMDLVDDRKCLMRGEHSVGFRIA